MDFAARPPVFQPFAGEYDALPVGVDAHAGLDARARREVVETQAAARRVDDLGEGEFLVDLCPARDDFGVLILGDEGRLFAASAGATGEHRHRD